LKSLPESIGNLKLLEVLNVEGNQLESLPDVFGRATNLKVLNVSNNNLLFLPSSLGFLKQEVEINIQGNKKIQPNSLLNKKSKEIIEYLGNVSENGEKCNLVKVVIVGQEGVGKTRIVHAMSCLQKGKTGKKWEKQARKLFESEKTESTDGIDVHNITIHVPQEHGYGLPKEKLRVQLFDFGGQEVFTMSHSVFLSNDAVYILAFNPLKPESENRISYWMGSLAASLGNEANSFHVLVVATHADATSQQHIDERFENILNRVEAKMLRITKYNCFAVSSKTLVGFDAFLTRLRLKSIADSKYVGIYFPKTYFTLENKVTQFAEECRKNKRIPVMSWSNFVSKFVGSSLSEDQVKEASIFLHRLGLLVHIDQGMLSNWVILDPQWLARVMASLVSFRTAGIIKNGILKRSDIKTFKLWANYPEEIHEFLFSLLEKYSIIVPINEEETEFLVAAMLNKPNENAIEQVETISSALFQRHYQVSFVPNDLFARLVSRLFYCFDLNVCSWDLSRFEWNLSECKGEIVLNENVISLNVWGSSLNESQKWYLVAQEQIVATLDFWHGIKLEQMIITRDGSKISNQFDNNLPEFKRLIEAEYFDSVAISKKSSFATLRTFDGDTRAIMKQCEKSDVFKELLREIEVMEQLEHRNIASLLGVMVENDLVSMFIETSTIGYLNEIITRDISEEIRLRIALDIAIALSYLHSQRPRLVHRNVNANNILVIRLDGRIKDLNMTFGKLSGFDSCIRCIGSISDEIEVDERFSAPEIISKQRHSHKCDSFSFGIVLWSLMSHRLPNSNNIDFNALNVSDEKKKEVISLIERCCAIDGKQRIEMDQVSQELARLIGIDQIDVPRTSSIFTLNESAQSISSLIYPEGIEAHAQEIEMISEFIKSGENKMKMIDIDGKLFEFVASHVCSNKQSQFEIKSIQLICNPLLATRFAHYCRNGEEKKIEMHYHYANPQALRFISQGGFNTSFCGEGWYGYGVYFSPFVEYALVQYGFLVKSVYDSQTHDLLCEFSIRIQEKTKTGRKPMLVLFENEKARQINEKMNDRSTIKIDLNDNTKVILDDKKVILKHNRECVMEERYVVMLCLIGIAGECVVSRDNMENKLCHKTSWCGGPHGSRENNTPPHNIHVSPESKERCVPMRHGQLGGNDTSTEFQILPRYIINFTGTPAKLQKERK
jgi:serine/threonine protein kinase/GTPase SAR1 family protein